MTPLSQAQFDMVRRGSEAAANQTRPLLGTVKKVADALGYQLGRKTEERVTLDENGNRVRGRVQTSRGFRTTTTGYDTNGITGEDMTHSGVPGPLGGRRTTTVIRGQNPNPMPGYGPHPYQPPAPGPTAPTQPGGPTSPTNPTVPLRQPMPFTPNPRGMRPNGMMNARFWPGETPQAPSPFHHTPQPVNLSQPLPFNGSPQGRSDYGNPFGTP